MPILIGAAPVTPGGGPPPPAAPPGRRTIELSGANGDVLHLTNSGGGIRVLAMRGVLGLPPVDTQMREGIGDGARYQRTRRLARPMDLRLRFSTSTPAQLRLLLDRLAAILDGGECTLTVRQPDGSGRSIGCHYTAGAELETGGTAGTRTAQEVPLTLIAPDPFYFSTEPITLRWGLAGGKALLGSGDFFPIVLTGDGVFGTADVTNIGDIAANALWTIDGPGGPVTISPTGGTGFTIPDPLGLGDSILVDTSGPTVVDGAGVNVYDRLGPAPKIWTIPPGVTSATVAVADATDDTSVTLTYRPRFRRGG